MPFEHRVLLNWINDISSVPRHGQRWPMIDLDDGLVQDYRDYIDESVKWGFNAFTVWGLFVNHAWPVDIVSCYPERRRYVEAILNHAEKRGMRMMTGFGVYSWGFEEFIKHNPALKRSVMKRLWGNVRENGEVMCFHSPEAREAMERVADFALSAGVHGFGMQAADQGRCICPDCAVYSDTAYYAEVCAHTARYIRGKAPDKLLSVSGWGMSLSGDREALVKLGKTIDYVTDVTGSSGAPGSDQRRSLYAELPCAVGTVGGTIVVPPHGWDRLRWFFPHIRVNGEHIRALHGDGGRAMEYFTGVLSNPGDEVTLKAVGRLLQNPECTVDEAAAAAAEDVFGAADAQTAETLAGLMLLAEDAYFGWVAAPKDGEFDLEPLMAVDPGPPIYLRDKPREGLFVYADTLRDIEGRLRGLSSGVRKKDALERCLISIANTIADIGL
jgi:hypothetical protein